jgi:hypothetical protein
VLRQFPELEEFVGSRRGGDAADAVPESADTTGTAEEINSVDIDYFEPEAD